MRKLLLSTINEKGFILVHVLFVVSLLFIIISSSISAYRNEIYINNRQIEQIKVESLFQIAQESYKRDFLVNNEFKETYYTFPQGRVEITILNIETEYAKLAFEIWLDDNPRDFFSLRHLFVYN
ncbi:hypothetical protein [Oceanobacillus sp. CAU 1775]